LVRAVRELVKSAGPVNVRAGRTWKVGGDWGCVCLRGFLLHSDLVDLPVCIYSMTPRVRPWHICVHTDDESSESKRAKETSATGFPAMSGDRPVVRLMNAWPQLLRFGFHNQHHPFPQIIPLHV
jgi:hypothetical protein